MKLTIEFRPDGKPGRGIATARLDGEIVATDTLDLNRALARKRFVEQIREGREGIDPNEVEAELLQRLEEENVRADAKQSSKAKLGPVTPSERERVEALDMLRDPNLITRIVDDAARLGVSGERRLAATVYIVGTSRLLSRPLAIIIQGLTSSGKSFVPDVVGRMFPPEAVLRAHAMTAQALYHVEPGTLEHRFVVAGERSRKQDDDTANATKALRELLSDGRLSKLIATKDGGRIVTEEISLSGPIAYCESTTLTNILDEDANRCIRVGTDESPRQTRRILQATARRKSGAESLADSERDEIIARHWAAQRLLRKVGVNVPYAERLAEKFPFERVDARRSFTHLLSFIEALALLHQFQRTPEPLDGQTIEATPRDYEIARELLAEPFLRAMQSGVSGAVKNFLDRIREWFEEGDTFATRDLASREKIIGDPQTIRQYVRALVAAGELDEVEAARGRRAATFKLAPPRHAADVAGLPTLDEIFSLEESPSLLRQDSVRVVAQECA